MTMTTKELLALVGKWRTNVCLAREEKGLLRAADELAPIATALCAEVEAQREELESLRGVLLDGYAVYSHLNAEGKKLTTAQVSDVLDAIVKLHRAARSRNEHEG